MGPSRLSTRAQRWRGLIPAAVAALCVVAAAWGAIHLLELRAASDSATTLRQTSREAHDRLVVALARARATATVLAADPRVDKLLLGRGGTPTALLRAHPRAAIFDGAGVRRAGSRAPYLFHGEAGIVVGGKRIGRVEVGVPFAEIAAVSRAPYAVTVLRGTRPGDKRLGEKIAVTPGRVTTVRVGNTHVRVLRSAVGRGRSLVAWVRTADVGASRRSEVLVIAAAVAAWLALFFALPGRGAREEPVGASPETLRLFGEALAASHEPSMLLAAFLRIAVEATGARGGAVIENGRVVERTGAAGHDLEIPIRVGGTASVWSLALAAPPEGFGIEALDRARALALQVSAALTNAHLHEVAQERSLTDELTSLSNRRHFIEMLRIERERSLASSAPLSLIVADLDNFKRVNDEFGHQAGDLALRHFAGIIGLYTRDIDIPARVGGDEFMVLLPKTDAPGAGTLADRIRSATASVQLASRDGRAFSVTASLGVASLEPGQTAEDFVERADAALYDAKAAGRNTVVVADPQPSL